MKTKVIVALVIVTVLAVALFGLVSAKVAPTPTPSGTTLSGEPYNGFFGWMGHCLGVRGSPSYGTQAPTSQGYYGYGCGGMRGFYP